MLPLRSLSRLLGGLWSAPNDSVSDLPGNSPHPDSGSTTELDIYTKQMMESLLRKVVIITGASAGIGQASALELAKYGCRLVLHGRNQLALEDVKQQCLDKGLGSSDVVKVTGDIALESTIDNIVDVARKAFGTIDIIMNNAGYVHPKDGPIHMGGTIEAVDEMFKVYVRAPYLLVQKCLPELEKNKGVVVNCSSGLSKGVDPNLTAYSLNKAALDQLTRLMAVGLGMRGIRVNSINPGYVDTKIIERNHGAETGKHLMGFFAKCSPFEQRLPTPEEIGRLVAFMASDQSAALTGANVVCDLGLSLHYAIVDINRFK